MKRTPHRLTLFKKDLKPTFQMLLIDSRNSMRTEVAFTHSSSESQ